MSQLATYLKDRVPEGMAYADAVQLCLRLYCTVDGVPDRLLPLSREAIEEAFAMLGRAGWVLGGPEPDQTLHRTHWENVMLGVFKALRPDMERGEILARQVGFMVQKG
jgi:hypothetical protein